jgi:hypothetical protein
MISYLICLACKLKIIIMERKKNGHKGVLKLNVEDMVERAIENRLEQ